MVTPILVHHDRLSARDKDGISSALSNRVLIAGWAAVLVASDLDYIIARVAGLDLPHWTPLPRAAALLVLALIIPRSGRLVHARGFVLALATFVTGHCVVDVIQRSVPWFTGTPHAWRMLVRVFLRLIPAALMGLTLVGSQLSRSDLFLGWGDLRARASLPFVRGARWSLLSPVLLLFTSAILVLQLCLVSHSSERFHPTALVWAIPAAVLFAIVNASWEEFCFRCILLARGVRAFGVSQAVAATSLLFGLAHYGGHPSGFSGVVMASFLAWILARSMVDTRGWGWAWLLHFAQDVIIFSAVVVTGA
jgi:membrane protease YdiL (CAAX protease family)